MGAPGEPARTPLPATLLAAVVLVDLLLARLQPGLVVIGLLDWTGHLATAGLVLLAGLRVPAARLPVVLAAAVLVDLDHVPLYAGVPGVEAAGGRPLTHGLVTVGLLLLAGRRWPAARWAALGVLLHLLRDLATGPGVPLLWPLDVAVRVPWAAYAVVLVLLAGRAALAPRAGRPAPT